MFDGFSRVLGSTEQEGVRTGRSAHGQLVQSQRLTTSLLDSGSGGGCEAESGDGELGNGEETVVVGDGAHNDDGLALVFLCGTLALGDGYEAGNGDGRAVDAGHEEAAEDDLVEVGVGTACAREEGLVWSFSGLRGSLKTGDSERTSKEAIELHQELEIDIVALRSLAVGVPHMVTLQVDTCISTHTHNPVSEISSKRHRFGSGKKGEGASLRPLYIPHLEGNSTYPWLRC